MATKTSNTFNTVTSSGNYPNATGIRLGLQSRTFSSTFYPVKLMAVNLMLAGTWGSSPSAKIQVMDRLGTWVDTAITMTAVGQKSGIVEGCAVRAVLDPGTSPGTGANAPRYNLGVEALPYLQTGEFSG